MLSDQHLFLELPPVISIFQTLLTSTELYKFIGIEAINDDKFLNLVGALGNITLLFSCKCIESQSIVE